MPSTKSARWVVDFYEKMLMQPGYTRQWAQKYITALTGWTDSSMYDLYGESQEIKFTSAKAELAIK